MTQSPANRPARPFSVFALFFLIGLFFSWPLAGNLFNSIPYAYIPAAELLKSKLIQGDHLQFYYHLGLLKHAALGHIEWFTNPLEFATEYQSKGFYSYFMPLSFLYLPFTAVSTPLAYNLFLLITFALGGLAMYLWAWQVTGNRFAALMAGVVFNFAPIRQVELFGGHPAGFAIFMAPLTMYFFDRAMASRKIAQGVLAGLCAFLLAFQYLQFGYYMLMFLIVYIPWMVWTSTTGSGLNYKTALRAFAPTMAPFLTGLAGAVGWMYYFKKSAVKEAVFSAGRTMDEISLFSPKLSSAWDPDTDFSVYIGLPLLMVVAALALGVAALKWKSNSMRDAIFFSAVFVLAYILSFGVTLNGIIPLYTVFYKYFPYFNLSRTPAKMMLVSLMSIAMLTAVLAAWSIEKERWRRVAGVVLIAFTLVVMADWRPARGVGMCVLDEGNAIYKDAAQRDGGKILNLPIWPGESSWESIYQYYAISSGAPMINGYSPLVSKRYAENVFMPLFSLNAGDVTQKQAHLLKELGVTNIIFHEEAYPPKVSAYPAGLAVARLARSPYLKLVRHEGPLWLFELSPESGEGKAETIQVSSPVGVFYEAEHLAPIGGKRVEDKRASGGIALLMEKAEPGNPAGIINAGPYRTFPSGKYTAVFRMRTVDGIPAEAPVAKLDVAADEGRTIVKWRKVNGAEFGQDGGYQDIQLEFELAPGGAWQLEFRAYLAGSAPVWLDSVYVLPAERVDPQFEFEAEELFHTGDAIKDENASGGLVVRAEPGKDPIGPMVFGPWRMFEAGDYSLRVYMRSECPAGIQGGAGVSIHKGGEGKLIMKSDTPPAGQAGSGYGETALKFHLDEKGPLEFKVVFSGACAVMVDKLRVEADKTSN
ncbi:MAG: hypothetical protein HY751_13125 [Nitrospinae bacterium]|nr:hypothetical protein [Nitrospinota bacterium]